MPRAVAHPWIPNRELRLARKKTFDYVIPVEPIYSTSAANLSLMRRLDLHAAMTKINLWNQTQFRQIVYVDADMVALRAPDELFGTDAAFAAAPDVGWPDCFNSGLMVVKPDQKTYEELISLASQGQSFDGEYPSSCKFVRFVVADSRVKARTKVF